MQVLVHLAEHAGEVVPKELLISNVWADTFVTDDVSDARHFRIAPSFFATTPKPRR